MLILNMHNSYSTNSIKPRNVLLLRAVAMLELIPQMTSLLPPLQPTTLRPLYPPPFLTHYERSVPLCWPFCRARPLSYTQRQTDIVVLVDIKQAASQ